MSPSWLRICGVHVMESGQVACVWLAHDKEADCIHVYDSHKHEREVLAVQAESIKRRGKWIPVAWCMEDKDIVAQLKEHGCNMLAEFDIPKNSDAIAESVSLDIWERMRTGRFKVAKHLEKWLDEYKSFYRQESRVPRETHPLMSATRHAVANIKRARSKSQHDKANMKIVYPAQSLA